MATKKPKLAPKLAPQDSSLKPQGSYTVLARRYRSRSFDELIGQEPIARTLRNAIRTHRTAHAYLFCGTRGVGKTSMARIFAKELNATDDLTEQDAIAEAILRGDDLDVIEIDGASNRGINEARDLIANAGLSPARCPYKIYIIDEVHMLTRDAFNALLKTMEEPPSHVKFILCTTEANKVPATIQSRCQRFDFRAIPTAKIAEQLRTILKNEELDADDEAVMTIARLGRGSMRDALSLLDRLLAGAEGKLKPQDVEDMLGLPDHTLVTNLVEAFIAADPAQALTAAGQIIGTGTTVDQTLEMLAEHLRTIMIVQTCGHGSEVLDLSEESRATAAKQADHFDAPALVHMIAMCDAAARNARGSTSSRALFDALMVRMALSNRFADISSVLQGGKSPAAAKPAATVSKKNVAPPALIVETQVSRPENNKPAPAVTEVKPSPLEESANDGETLWNAVLQCAAASIPDRNRTEHLRFQSFDGRTLNLAVAPSGAHLVRLLTSETSKLGDLVKRATGRAVRVVLDSTAASRLPEQPPRGSELEEASRVPAVARVMNKFDASLVAVQKLESKSPPGEEETNGADNV